MIQQLWAEYAEAKISPDVGPHTRRHLRAAYAAGGFAVLSLLGELESFEPPLPRDLRREAILRLDAALIEFAWAENCPVADGPGRR